MGGYTGAVAFRITALTTVPYACFAVANVNITGTAAVTAAVTITTDVTTCPSGTTPFVVAGSGTTVAALTRPAQPRSRWPQPFAAALAGAFLLASLSRRKLLRGKLRSGIALGLLLALGLSGLGLSGCSNGSNTTPSTTTTTTTTTTTVTTTAGAYPLTVTGYNPANSSQAATTTLTLTVQ